LPSLSIHPKMQKVSSFGCIICKLFQGTLYSLGSLILKSN
jgi:hypothetical protein